MINSTRLTAFTFLAMLLLALTPMHAQTSDADVAKRLDLLEQKLSRLEERVNAALPPDATAVPSASGDRVSALESKIAVLEQQKAVVNTPTDAPKLTANSNDFSISSADGGYKLRFGAHIQMDGRNFLGDSSPALTDTYLVRRARPILTGSLGKYIEFRLVPDFGNGTTALYDAYGDVVFSKAFEIRGGKFKTPMGLEVLQNDADITFLERSLVSDLLPNRDEGFMAFGTLGKRMEYQVAVLNGAPDGTNLDIDNNDGKDVVGRLFFTPFAPNSGLLKGLGFGIAASTGDQSAGVLPSFKSSSGQNTFFSYSSSTKAAGNRYRYSPQMYYYVGPFGLMAEYAVTEQQLTNTTTERLSNHAWQVSGSWMLTGKNKGYGRYAAKGTQDTNPNPLHGGLEIAGRYGGLTVDSAAFNDGFADITKAAESARQWTLGTNYYIGRNTKLSLNYEHTNFQGGAKVGNRPTEEVFSQRLQFIF
jgi:phosphate-selective porin OprO/OprP